LRVTDRCLDAHDNASYAEFFSLAKEITTLENDLLELKASLAEWKSMPSLLNIDDSSSTGIKELT
jgi:hypothetical protein